MKILITFILTLFTASAFAGGISGGGGGTIIPDPAGTEFIVRQLSGARISLLMFLKNMSYGPDAESLFKESNNILEKVKQYSLKIETEKPCYDFDGNPNDGSINSDPNTICISAKTIGEKVSIVTAYPQLLALMAHEYSHLIGYDENQADAFQKRVLFLTKSVSEGDGFSVASQFMHDSNTAIFMIMHAQAVFLLGNEPVKIYDAIKEADDTSLFPYQYPMRALDKDEAKKVEELAIRIKNLRLYSCSQYDFDPNQKEMCGYQYKNIFEDADEVTATVFSWAYYGNSSHQPTGAVPNLIKNSGKFSNEMTAVQDELRAVSEAIGEQLSLRD